MSHKEKEAKREARREAKRTKWKLNRARNKIVEETSTPKRAAKPKRKPMRTSPSYKPQEENWVAADPWAENIR